MPLNAVIAFSPAMAGVVALVGGVVAGRSTVKVSFGERCCAGAELGDGEYGYKACIGIWTSREGEG